MNEQPKEIPKFDLSKVAKGPSAKAKEIMKKLDEEVFYIEDYVADDFDHFDDTPKYDEFLEELRLMMLHGFEWREFRDHVAFYKFRHDDNEEPKHMKFRHFILNATFWRLIVCVDINDLTDKHILTEQDFKKLSGKFIADYINTFFILPNRGKLENYIVNGYIHDFVFQITRISAKFNKFFGIPINVESFYDLAERNPDFKKGLYFQIDETKQPAEIEQDCAREGRAQVDRILNDSEFNPLKPLLAPKAIKEKQFYEVSSVISLKPDVDGKTISKPINNNFITGNLGSVVKYYINNISGRKAAIINNEFMGSAGHMAILTSIMTASVKLSKTVMDCHSANPIPVWVYDEKYLKKLDGRRYRFSGMTEYKTVNSLTDKFLIGQQIWIRSPITCCAHDGVCKECYGDLYYTNNDLNSAGAYSATIIMNPVMQGLLSAKHHQSTSSNMITFQEEFDDFFTISATDIILNNTIDDVESYSLVIMRDDFCSSEDGDDDDSDSLSQVSSTRGRHSKKNSQQYDDGDSEDDSMNLVLSYYTTRFFVVKNLHNKKKQEWIEFYDKDKKELFMHDDFVNSLVYRKDDDGKEYFFINLEDLDLEKFIFMVDVENNELTKPMKAIEKLINNKNHEGCSTYEEMCQKMLDLIIQSGLESTSVHGEMIIRNLIREKGENGLNRPDFSRLIMSQDYEILTVKTALKRNPSITTSLSTPYLKYQLINMNETFDKTDLSDLDPLFRKTLTVEETIE